MANTSTRMAHVVITMDGANAIRVIDQLKQKSAELAEEMQQMKDGPTEAFDETKYKELEKNFKAIEKALKDNYKSVVDIDQVISHLSDQTFGTLRSALRAIRSDIRKVSENEPERLTDLREKYALITEQLKKLGFEYVDVEKVIQNLDTASERQLRQALLQMRDLQSVTERGTEEYASQSQKIRMIETALSNIGRVNPFNILNNLAGSTVAEIKSAISEMERLRDTTTAPGTDGWKLYNESIATARAYLSQFNEERQKMSLGQAIELAGGDTQGTIGDLREAVSTLKEYRETLNANDTSGIQSVDRLIEQLNEKLSVTHEKTIDISNILSDPQNFSPEQLKKAIAELNRQLDKLAVNDPKREGIRKQIEQLDLALKKAGNSSVDVNHILANLKTASIDDLKTAAAQLEKEMNAVERNTKEYTDTAKNLSKVRNEIENVNKSFHKQDSILKQVASRLSAYVLIYSGFNIVKNEIGDVIKKNFEFSDSLANIRKTTGLTETEVNKLSESINEIDSRQGTEELHRLAYEAGRMGVGKFGAEGVEQFVKAADKIGVALKEDLGDDAIEQIYKIADVMGDLSKLGVEEALLSSGSALNVLVQTGTSNAGWIVDFTSRMAGIARQSNLTTAEVMGFGAALDEMNQEVEVSATSMNKFITQMFTHYKTVAKASGMNEKVLKDMLEQNRTADAVVAVLSGLKDKGGLSQLAPLFKDLGSDGTRLSQTLAAMVSNIDKVQASLNTSRQAFGEATSVTQEYNIANETANAIMERIKNSWEKMFVNADNSEALKELAIDLKEISDDLQKNGAFVNSLRLAFLALTSTFKLLLQLAPAFLTFFSFKIISIAAIPIFQTLRNIWIACIQGITTLTNSVRGNTTATIANGAAAGRAALGWKAMTLAMRVNVIIGIVSILIQICYWLGIFNDKMKDAGDQSESMESRVKQAVSQVSSEYGKEMIALNNLFDALNKTNISQSQRKDIINKINSSYGQYLDHLLSEKSSLGEIKKAYDKINDAIKTKFYLSQRDALINHLASNELNKYLSALVDINKLSSSRISPKTIENLYEDYTTGRKKLKTDTPLKYMSDERIEQTIIDTIFEDVKYSVRNQPDQFNSSVELPLRQKIKEYVQNRSTFEYQNKAIEQTFKKLLETEFRPFGTANEEQTVIIDQGNKNEEQKKINKLVSNTKKQIESITADIQAFYNLQLAKIDMDFAEGKITSASQESMTQYMKERMNLALMNVRYAISGMENNWEQFKKEISEMDNWSKLPESQKILKDILSANINNIHNVLSKFGQGELDEIRKNATKNFQEIKEQARKESIEIRKILLQADYTGKVDSEYASTFEKLKFLTVDYAKFFQNLFRDIPEKIFADFEIAYLKLRNNKDFLSIDIQSESGYEKARDMISTYSPKIADMLKENPDLVNTIFGNIKANAENPDQKIMNAMKDFRNNISEVYAIDIDTTEGIEAFRALLSPLQVDFPKIMALNEEELKVFYRKIIEYNDAWDDADKKRIERAKKRLQFNYEKTDTYKEDQDYIKKNESNAQIYKMMETVGLTSAKMQADQEVALYKYKLEAAENYYNYLKKHNADKKILDEQQIKIDEARLAYTESLVKQTETRLAYLREYMKGVEQFGEEFGKAIFGSLSDRQKSFENFVQSIGETTKKLLLDWIKQKIEHALIRTAMIETENNYNSAMSDAGKESSGDQQKLQKITFGNLLKNLFSFHKKKENEEESSGSNMTEIAKEEGAAQTMVQETFGQVQVQGQQAINTQITNLQKQQAQETVQTKSAEAQAGVAAGTAEGAATIIAKLGFWGIPLIAVITALLNSLLGMAMSKISGLFGGGNGSSAPTIKPKIVTGMLTYDQGNVQAFSGIEDGHSFPAVGDDGKVYRATRVEQLQTGIVSDPIAALVNGRPALIAEKGPEMIIGRKTTAAMMQNNPELLRAIVRFDKNKNTYRTFDQGNVSDFSTPTISNDPSTRPYNDLATEELKNILINMATYLSESNKTNIALTNELRKGIHAKINKYGHGGLVEETVDGIQFLKKQGKNHNIKKLFS